MIWGNTSNANTYSVVCPVMFAFKCSTVVTGSSSIIEVPIYEHWTWLILVFLDQRIHFKSLLADLTVIKIGRNNLQSHYKGEAPSYDQSIKSKMVETQDAGGWKLWKCSDCDYTNKKTSHLYRHIERRHFSVTLACEFCAQTFTCSQALATHQKHSCCSWDLKSTPFVTQSWTRLLRRRWLRRLTMQARRFGAALFVVT